MTDTRRFLFRMAIFLAAVIAGLAVLSPGLVAAFTANMALNGLILFVLLVGIALNFRHVVGLKPEIAWMEEQKRGIAPLSTSANPALLGPIATALAERRERAGFSAPAMRALLDGVASRLDEQRELSRYFVGLMIFLGLLGTFWGLSQTVGSISDVIRSLTIVGDDVGSAFEGLKSGLEAPLDGMGTAFSSSLFGLGGSLIVGFLDLQAGQAQNSFFNDLEEWLSGQTKFSAGNSINVDGGDQSVPAYIQALLEQSADSLDNLQRVITRGEESRIATNTSIRTLTDKLSTLGDHMKTEQALMVRIAEAQLEMKPILAKLAEANGGGMDDTTRSHIRNMDGTLRRMAEEATQGREEMVAQIRSEAKLLARTIAAAAEDASAAERAPY